ncbi:hypothetical protein [Kordiimonas sp.]|uniref:hypothetical protein n=1 Tax=Kordiimonas sp. TaxID=1970157 RepID=UPI003A8F9FAD
MLFKEKRLQGTNAAKEEICLPVIRFTRLRLAAAALFAFSVPGEMMEVCHDA